jgi:predicted CXXCH cytochrome family protein
MLIKIKSKTASHPVAISCLIGLTVLSLAQMAGAFASANSSGNSSKETCAFTLQLQSSVSARRQYLVKLDQAVGRTATASNSVEDMYGNIRPASYEPGDDAEESSLSTVAGKTSYFYTPKKSVTVVGLDSFSADCVSCHDGVSASTIGIDLRNNPMGRKSQVDSFQSDHPIGMNYNNYVAADKGFKSVRSNTTMIFVDGKVGCLTCHDPLSSERGHLVMSDKSSALCLTCHNK